MLVLALSLTALNVIVAIYSYISNRNSYRQKKRIAELETDMLLSHQNILELEHKLYLSSKAEQNPAQVIKISSEKELRKKSL